MAVSKKTTEEEMYKDLMEIEELVGHENITLNKEEKEDVEITLEYLISYFEEQEDYMKCKNLKDISDIISKTLWLD
jgi:hypothetical protein